MSVSPYRRPAADFRTEKTPRSARPPAAPSPPCDALPRARPRMRVDGQEYWDQIWACLTCRMNTHTAGRFNVDRVLVLNNLHARAAVMSSQCCTSVGSECNSSQAIGPDEFSWPRHKMKGES